MILYDDIEWWCWLIDRWYNDDDMIDSDGRLDLIELSAEVQCTY